MAGNASGFNNRPSNATNLANNLASNVSGVFSTKIAAKYTSGARTMLKINGKLVAFAFGVSWRINTAVTDINTIDNPFPAELVPQRVTVEGSISAMHIPGQSAGTELWQPDVLNFLFQQYLTIEVRDTSDQLLFYASKAMITSRSEDLRVDSLGQVTLTFRAIGFQDERRPEVAQGALGGTSGGTSTQPQSRLKQITSQVADKLRNFGF